jgi:hypothetical protein
LSFIGLFCLMSPDKEKKASRFERSFANSIDPRIRFDKKENFPACYALYQKIPVRVGIF